MTYLLERNLWVCLEDKPVELPSGKIVNVPARWPTGHRALSGELLAQARAEDVDLELPPDELDDDGRVRRAA